MAIPGEYITGGFSLASMALGYVLSRQNQADKHRRKMQEDMVKLVIKSEEHSKSDEQLWLEIDKLRETVAGLEGLFRGIQMYPDLFHRREKN